RRVLFRSPHPAEAAAEVGGVDRVETVLGVDVDDAAADVQPVVVLLEFLVLVERFPVPEGPLALGLLALTRGWHGARPRLRSEGRVAHRQSETAGSTLSRVKS